MFNVLTAILIITFFCFVFFVFNNFIYRPRDKVLKIFRFNLRNGDINGIIEFFKKADFFFVFEIAVQQIGKEVNYYLITFPSFEKKLVSIFKDIYPDVEISKEDDYIIFNPEGSVSAAYFEPISVYEISKLIAKGQSMAKGSTCGGSAAGGQPNFASLDFSKVNEVGESAAVQMIPSGCPSAIKSKKEIEIRFLSSAPTPYQSKEILDSFVSSRFSDLKVREPKNKASFISKFNFREP